MGRGARAAALTWRAVRREAFFPGYVYDAVSIATFWGFFFFLKVGLGARLVFHIPDQSGCEPVSASPCGSLPGENVSLEISLAAIIVGFIGGACSRLLTIFWLCLIA